MHSDFDLDVGVLHVGGGYRINWDDYMDPYWVPLAPDDIFEIRYVVDWGTPEQSIFVKRYRAEELPQITRSGEFLERAYQRMIEYSAQEVEISVIPIDYSGTVIDTIIMSNGTATIYQLGLDYDMAKWQIVGLWGLENVQDLLSPTYLKIRNESGVFIIDEKTFLIL
jgi:hypothetical protein